MKTKFIFSAILMVIVSFGLHAQQVKQKAQQTKKQADPFRYKMEDNKLKLEKTYFNFGNAFNTVNKKESTAILNDSDEPMEITFSGVPKYMTVTVFPKFIPAKSKGTISVEYRAGENKTHDGKQNWGSQNARINLIVNGNTTNRKNRLSIRANIQEDFASMTPEQKAKAPKIEFKETTFNFGTVKQGENVVHEFSFKNVGVNELEIRKVKGS